MDNMLTGLPNFVIEKIVSKKPLVFEVKFTGIVECPACNSKELRIKDSFWRIIKNIPIDNKSSKLLIKAHKYCCKSCGKYFNSRFYGIKKWNRTTEPVKKRVFWLYNKGYSCKDISKEINIGYASVERYYQSVTIEKNKHYLSKQCPRILGIDEHRFTKKVGYVTTFCDLKNHTVFDIAKGRSESELFLYLSNLKGRSLVRVVCIDMNSSYRSIVRKWFPNAKIVSDRFHVIRLVNHHFAKVCKSIDEANIAYGRGGIMRLLVTIPEKLSEKQKAKRDAYFETQAAIKNIYYFVHELNTLLRLKEQNKTNCREHIQKLLEKIKELKDTPFQALKTLGKTLFSWKEEVVRMFRFSRNNGITEGFHRKMKLIQRRAYGFRNFENYRLRVRVLCC